MELSIRPMTEDDLPVGPYLEITATADDELAIESSAPEYLAVTPTMEAY
jgi:hypothetical protein